MVIVTRQQVRSRRKMILSNDCSKTTIVAAEGNAVKLKMLQGETPYRKATEWAIELSQLLVPLGKPMC
jgi:hypothetical protein